MPLDAVQEHSGQQRGQQAQQARERQGEEQQHSRQQRAEPPASYLPRWAEALGLRKLSTCLLAVILLAAVPVFAVQVHAELEHRERRRGEVTKQVQLTAERVAARLDRLIDNARVVLATVGRFPNIAARDRTACADVLSSLSGEFPHLAVLAAVTPAGEVFCTSDPQLRSTGVSLADRDYFQRALRAEAPVLSDLITGRATDRKVLVVAQPVVDPAGNLETVMTLSLEPERIARLLSEVARPEGATIRVLDRAGHVVAHVPHGPELIGQKAEGTPPPDPSSHNVRASQYAIIRPVRPGSMGSPVRTRHRTWWPK